MATINKSTSEKSLVDLIGQVSGRSGEVQSTAQNIIDRFFGMGPSEQGSCDVGEAFDGVINSAENNLKRILDDLNLIERHLSRIEQRIA